MQTQSKRGLLNNSIWTFGTRVQIELLSLPTAISTIFKKDVQKYTKIKLQKKDISYIHMDMLMNKSTSGLYKIINPRGVIACIIFSDVVSQESCIISIQWGSFQWGWWKHNPNDSIIWVRLECVIVIFRRVGMHKIVSVLFVVCLFFSK